MPLASSRNSNLTCNWMTLKDALPSYFEHFGQLLLVRTKKGFIDGGLPAFFWLHMKMKKHWSSSALRSGICMSSHRTPLRHGKVTGRLKGSFLRSTVHRWFCDCFMSQKSHSRNFKHLITCRIVHEFHFSCGDFCLAGSPSYPGSLGFAEPVPWGFCGRCPLGELDNGMRSLKIVWWWLCVYYFVYVFSGVA